MILDSGAESNWLHHFMSSVDVPNAKTGSNLVHRFNKNRKSQGFHTFIESFLSLKLILRALKKWIRLILISWELSGVDKLFTPQGSNASLWPMLKKDWLSSIEGATSIINCLFIELFDAALKNIPHQSNGLYLFENQMDQRQSNLLI